MRRVPEGLPETFVNFWNKEHIRCNLQVNEINLGWCYQFALVMKALYGDRAQLFWNWDHAWVCIDGVHYDSSHPMGGVKPRAGYEEVKTGTIDQFVEFWKYGGSGEIRWWVIADIVAVYLPEEKPKEKTGFQWLMSLFERKTNVIAG